MSGVKRAVGTDEEKNPLGDVELSDEDAQKLQVLTKDIARAELALGTFVMFVFQNTCLWDIICPWFLYFCLFRCRTSCSSETHTRIRKTSCGGQGYSQILACGPDEQLAVRNAGTAQRRPSRSQLLGRRLDRTRPSRIEVFRT